MQPPGRGFSRRRACSVFAAARRAGDAQYPRRRRPGAHRGPCDGHGYGANTALRFPVIADHRRPDRRRSRRRRSLVPPAPYDTTDRERPGEDTHKFESRDLGRLMGSYPGERHGLAGADHEARPRARASPRRAHVFGFHRRARRGLRPAGPKHAGERRFRARHGTHYNRRGAASLRARAPSRRGRHLPCGTGCLSAPLLCFNSPCSKRRIEHE